MNKTVLSANPAIFSRNRKAYLASIHRQKSADNSLKQIRFSYLTNPLSFLKITLVVLVLTMASAFSNEALAQCSYVLIDTNNVTTTTVIPCDFPVYINTGNLNADLATYNAAKTAWLAINPGMDMVFDVPNAFKNFHINIKSSVFQGFSQVKKNLILAEPSYYQITP